jgi:hypothetical protein
VNKAQLLTKRVGLISLIAGLAAALAMALLISPAIAGFFALGVVAGTLNIHLLSLAIEHSLRTNLRGNRVKMFFLAHFLARYALIFAVLYVVASLRVQGLLAAVGGLLFSELMLWIQAVSLSSSRRRRG